MPCDSRPFVKEQTLQERIAQVRSAISKLDRLLLKRQVRVVVGPQGAITFTGWKDEDRAGVTDACAYRRIMISGSALAKAEIARAELLAGRKVDRKMVAQGVHSHDNGSTWHGRG